MFGVIKKSISYIILVSIIFISLIGIFDNKNIMIVNMNAKSGKTLEAEFYYTKAGIAFDDTKMSRRYKVKGNNYYFSLPKFNEIMIARLDPSKNKDTIEINNVKVIVNKWFNSFYYSVDIKKSEPANQIANYKLTKNGIKFNCMGKDPQININLTRKFLYRSRNWHIDTFIISILIFSIIIFLYRLSKNRELTPEISAKLILYSLFLSFSLFKVNYYKEHVHHNYSPDNIAHVSYIKYLHEHKEIIPKFENMYMITNKNAGNYLGHPPLFYYIMNLVYDSNKSAVNNIDNFRALNTTLFMISIILFLYLGFKSKFSLLGDLTYLSVITSIPMHGYLGGNITNDNLAIVGAAIFIIGFFRIINNNFNTLTYFIIGLGAFISYFAKFTAALLIFFAIVFFIVYIIKTKRDIKITKYQIILLSIFIAPPIIYQTYIMIHYHAIVPTLNITHPKEYLHSTYFIPESKRVYMNIIEWLKHYWSNIHAGWFGILSHHSLVKSSIFDYIGLLTLHILAIIVFLKNCPNDYKKICLLGKISLLSLFTVSAIQVTFSYMAHLHSGYTGGLQPRYLLPFMFAFAIMAAIFVNKYKKSWIVTILIIIICIQALYSDFFYFLKYYI